MQAVVCDRPYLTACHALIKEMNNLKNNGSVLTDA
jgi:hypothetical protein